MKDVSIEYSHIYTNNKIGKEQEVSLEILDKIRNDLQRQNKSYSLEILIDDYSFPDPTFDYTTFSSWLTAKGFKPDNIFRESQLIPLCDQVLQHLQNKILYEQIVDYIKTKKYPCSLFISAWYLMRLGYLHHDSYNEDLIAKRLVNILPESFKPFEDKGLEIIASTDFTGAEKQIEHIYIEGRLIV